MGFSSSTHKLFKAFTSFAFSNKANKKLKLHENYISNELEKTIKAESGLSINMFSNQEDDLSLYLTAVYRSYENTKKVIHKY